VYVSHLFKYFLYVVHAVPCAMVCWIARRSRAVAHTVLRASPHVVSRVIRALFARRRHSFARSCRAFGSRVARISRVEHVCRVVSAHDNKLFSLINSHVNNVNSLGHIF
jgi:hypothetical protein